MPTPTYINASLGAAWQKVLDKGSVHRYGHLYGTGFVDVAFANGGPVLTIVGTEPLLFHLPPHEELWARSSGGGPAVDFRGGLTELWEPAPFGDFTELLYRGTSLDDLLGGSSKVLHVDGGGATEYATVQSAIDDAVAGSGTTVVVYPGTYNENVVLKRGVYLRSGGFGFGGARDVRIQSASGDTLRIPHRDSGAIGITVESSGPNPTDVALRVIDDGLGAGLETFMLNFFAASMPGAQAQSIHVDPMPPNENAIMIYAGPDADTTAPITMELEGFLIWFLGGMGGNGGQIGVKIQPGGGLMCGAQVGLNADVAAGQCVDCDGGFFAALDCTIDGQHGIKGRNGSTLLLSKIASFGGIAGTPIDTDPTSFVLMGSATLAGFGGAPWANYSILGTILRLWSGVEGGGSIGLAGPDLRPTATGSNVPTGYRYTATDITIGAPGVPGPGGDLVYLTGVGWMDGAGAIHP